MRGISELLPLTWAVRAVQEPWLGSDVGVTPLLLLAGMVIVAGLLAIRSLRAS